MKFKGMSCAGLAGHKRTRKTLRGGAQRARPGSIRGFITIQKGKGRGNRRRSREKRLREKGGQGKLGLHVREKSRSVRMDRKECTKKTGRDRGNIW